jgi:cell division protein ZapE
MDRIWSELTGNHQARRWTWIKGRKVRVPLASMGSRASVCGAVQPLGITTFCIAHAFHTVLIDGIPSFGSVQRDVVRRFINLIDTL